MSAARARPRILPSPNHDSRPEDGAVDMLVLHYTGMRSAEEAIERLRDPAPPTGSPVSSHYVVEEDGTMWCLVPEERRAWHAGVSFWRGHSALNGRSVGIEIVNPGHEFGYRPFPPAQMEAVRDLCRDVLARHPIPAVNVVAHSDVAPDRKQDPGELFDWEGLARCGIGLWPRGVPDVAEDGEKPLRRVRRDLARIGYGIAPEGEADAALEAVLRAFQRHWRPRAVTGRADPDTAARIAAVAQAATGG